MRKSIGYGAYGGFGEFGYADEPQWGLFNPAQSLFKSDPTIYDSLYATNQDAEAGVDQARKGHRRYNPGLPRQVGPRKAWGRSGAHSLYGPKGTNPNEGLTPQGGLEGYGEESTAAETAKAAGLMMSPMVLLIGVILALKLFKVGG